MLPMKKNTFFTHITYLLTSAYIVTVLLTPQPVHAAITATTITGSINAESLQTNKTKPKLSGTLIGASSVRLKILKENTTKSVFTSKSIRVRNNTWSTTVSKKIPYGTYDVLLYTTEKGKKKTISTETLTISNDSAPKDVTSNNTNTALVVSSIPLLAPGTTSAGNTVPIAYLQVQNTGTQTAHLKGFWITQNGSAPTSAVIGLTAVDDQGGSRGASERSTTLFKNGRAFVPTETVFAPGYLRLYTIKAIIADNASQYSGSNLKLDVSSIETDAVAKDAFPIRGTTWMLK